VRCAAQRLDANLHGVPGAALRRLNPAGHAELAELRFEFSLATTTILFDSGCAQCSSTYQQHRAPTIVQHLRLLGLHGAWPLPGQYDRALLGFGSAEFRTHPSARLVNPDGADANVSRAPGLLLVPRWARRAWLSAPRKRSRQMSRPTIRPHRIADRRRAAGRTTVKEPRDIAQLPFQPSATPLRTVSTVGYRIAARMKLPHRERERAANTVRVEFLSIEQLGFGQVQASGEEERHNGPRSLSVRRAVRERRHRREAFAITAHVRTRSRNAAGVSSRSVCR